MLFLKTRLLPLVMVLVFLPIITKSENLSVDSILRQANLPKLIGTNEALNLAAQPLDPKGSSINVNTFNNFIALGVVSSPSVQTNMTSFNEKQVILQKASMAGPWIGVARYTQSEIPNVLLQTGLMDVQACMSKKGTPTPSKEVTNVVIYKTLILHNLFTTILLKYLIKQLAKKFYTHQQQKVVSLACKKFVILQLKQVRSKLIKQNQLNLSIQMSNKKSFNYMQQNIKSVAYKNVWRSDFTFFSMNKIQNEPLRINLVVQPAFLVPH